jgi:kinetochore protein NNF1
VELTEKIRQQRLEIESLLSGLEAIVADVEGAATATAQFSRENGIREEVVKMDEEVRARQEI